MALLYAWLAAATGREDDASRARHHRDQAIAGVAEESLDASLWDGFPGVAWAVELVDGLVDPGGGDRNEAIDDALEEMLGRRELWPLPHDLVSGVTGAGLYALSRLPRAKALSCLERLLERLEDAAGEDQAGVFWWTGAEQFDDDDLARHYPNGHGDLGVAHGVPGVIGLLGLLAGADVGGERTTRLLGGAVDWLWAQALPGTEGLTFPMFSASAAAEAALGPARSAWCYGDPGVAAALLLAGRGAGEPSWEKEATALAIRAARRPSAETGVEDACFCHGTAGLAHVYNRLYQATGEEALATAARYWLTETVQRWDAASSAGADDPAWALGGEDSPYWTGADIVDGAAGVALVLLAAASAFEPAWDRLFLLS